MFKRSSLSSAVAIAVAFSCQTIQAQEAPATPAATDGVEEIVVSGIRGSLTKALEIKKESKQIVDSIVAEDIGKFPDNNVTESLQRVTGVQVSGRGGGELDKITIRGLDDVSTTVNGRQIFTGTGRNVQLQDIPASLLNRVDVYKTRSADQLEGGIAGNIDIKTHRPFNFDGSKVVLAARGIYQSTSEKTDPSLSMLASDRWDTSAGEFGALVNLSYLETNYRDENIWIGSLDPYNASTMGVIRSSVGGFSNGTLSGLPTTPGSTLNVDGVPTEYYLLRDAMGSTDFNGTRKRPAANVSLQWSPNDTSEYLFETFYNGYRNQDFNSLLFLNTNGASQFRNPTLYEGTNVVKTNFVNNASIFTSGDGSTGKTDSWVYAIGGKWEIGDNLKLESEIVHQKSDFTRRFFAMQTSSTKDRLVVDFNHNNSGIPLVAFLDDETTAGIDEGSLVNPADYAMSNIYDNGNKDHGEANTWNLDGDYDADWGVVKKFSFGLRYDDRSASTIAQDQSGSCKGSAAVCSLASYPGLVNISEDGFFEGRAYYPRQWLAADGNYLLANSDTIRSAYGLQAGGSGYLPNKAFDINEVTSTAYAQADYEIDLGGHTIDGQIGVRFVKLDTTMDFMQDPDADGMDWQPIHSEVSESRALKSLTVRYKFTDDLMTRFAYGETVRRPTYGDLNPAVSYYPTITGLERGNANGGNPNLKPVESKNYDLSLEYYFADSSSIYGVLFKRDIAGFVTSSVTNIEITENTNPDLIGKYTLTQPGNSANGKLDGVELGVVYFPDSLPEWLQGAGVQASYTWLEGESYDPVFENGVVVKRETNPMPWVSESSYSLVLAYEKEDYSARLSYVWRDDFRTGTNLCCAMPSGVWSAPETSMDFQVSYNLTKDWVITLDATNITDEIYQGYYTNSELYNNGASIYSRTLALGTRFTF